MRISLPLFAPALLAIFVPSIVSAIYFAVLGGANAGVFVFLVAIAISAGHVLLLGLPSVWLLNRYHILTVTSVTLVGFLLGCIPMAIWSWFVGYSEFQGDWGGFLHGVGFMGLFGAIAGLSFWLAYRSFSPNLSVKRDGLTATPYL